MVPVLSDPALYDFTGGEPPTVQGLRRQYRLQAAGRSADGSQQWLNWVVRRREDERLVGYVQATVSSGEAGEAGEGDEGGTAGQVAEVAWVVGTAFQGRGYA